jgi:hypothetical protein
MNPKKIGSFLSSSQHPIVNTVATYTIGRKEGRQIELIFTQ